MSHIFYLSSVNYLDEKFCTENWYLEGRV